MKFTVYKATVRGQGNNCLYPEMVEVTDEESLKSATSMDYVVAKYKDNYRTGDNFVSANCLALDCDNDDTDIEEDWISPSNIKDLMPNVSFAVHYSRNHQRQKGSKSPRPRFHILFPIKEVTDKDIYKEMKLQLNAMHPFFDTKAMDAARFFYGTENPKVEIYDGDITLDEYLDSMNEDFDQDLPSNLTSIPEGSRNSTLSHFAGKIIKRLGDTDEAYTQFLEFSKQCDPPLEDDELSKIWHSAQKFFSEKVVKDENYLPPSEYGKECKYMPEAFTDLAQAEKFVENRKDIISYTDATGYLVYNSVKWEASKTKALGVCLDFLHLQLSEAEDFLAKKSLELANTGIPKDIVATGGKDLEKQVDATNSYAYKAYLLAKTYHKFALKRQDIRYINPVLQIAQPRVYKDIKDFDANPYQLNTPGGTVDLYTGKIYPHRAEDYITKVTSVSPGTDGMDIWLEAINTIFCGDEDLLLYVQRNVGLVLIGEIKQEAIICAYGSGANGKSTFWNVIAKVLGDYSGTISSDALITECKRNVKPEKAELKGKRFIIAAELDEGTRLNTSMVKQLTSTDRITGERKYHDPFDFEASHSLVLYTNHLPKINATDNGTWRRIIIIPFNAKIEGKSEIKNYAEYLYEKCGGAILTWMIEGAKDALAMDCKFPMPKVVEESIKGYREDNNWLGMFFEECCELAPEYKEKSGHLYSEFRNYCIRSGEVPKSTRDFYSALDNAGFNRKRTKQGVYIIGLRLKDDFTEDGY